MEQLVQFLAWAAGAGAGVIVSWVLDRNSSFEPLDKEIKRIISMVGAGFIGVLATLGLLFIGVALEKATMPGGWAAWLVIIADAAGAAIVAGLARHTATLFKKKK